MGEAAPQAAEPCGGLQTLAEACRPLPRLADPCRADLPTIAEARRPLPKLADPCRAGLQTLAEGRRPFPRLADITDVDSFVAGHLIRSVLCLLGTPADLGPLHSKF